MGIFCKCDYFLNEIKYLKQEIDHLKIIHTIETFKLYEQLSRYIDEKIENNLKHMNDRIQNIKSSS